MPVVIYPFRKRDPITGKWYRARWKASLEEIARLGGVVDGPPDVREHLGATSGFQVHRPPDPRDDELELHPQRAHPPAIDASERYLAALFLRRYATYCTRRRRFAQAQGAAMLFAELQAP